jgi:VPDSG-CTERM motif
MKRAILCSIFCVLLLAFNHNASATTLNFGDIRDLGSVLFGIPSGDADRTNYVNELISLAPGTMNFADPGTGQTYNRTLSVFGAPYPHAVFALNGPASDANVTLGLGGFTYLFAKYDGPNGGSEVWDVAGLSGTITIPANGLPAQNNQYGLSGWTLFTGGTTTVPDGGSTVALLGLALTGLAGIRAKFHRS